MGQLSKEPAPPADEGSILVVPGPAEGESAVLSDTAAGSDEWLALGLAETAADAIAVSLGEPGGWDILTLLSTDDEEVEIVNTGTRWPDVVWAKNGRSGLPRHTPSIISVT